MKFLFENDLDYGRGNDKGRSEEGRIIVRGGFSTKVGVRAKS